MTTTSGGLRDLIDGASWDGHALGARDAWSPCLESALAGCLGARGPAVLWWGPDHALLYNDAFRVLLGDRHPEALGACAQDAWPAACATLAQVYETGCAAWSEDQPLPLHAAGDAGAARYVTAAHSPVLDGGRTVGILTTLTETTRRVVASRRLALLARATNEAAAATDLGDLAARVVTVLGRDRPEVAFAALCRLDADGCAVHGAVGVTCGPDLGVALGAVGGGPASPAVLELDALSGRAALTPEDPAVRCVVAQPLAARPGAGRLLLLLGVSPQRPLDDEHRAFLDTLAAGIGAAALRLQHPAPPAVLQPAGAPDPGEPAFAIGRRVLVAGDAAAGLDEVVALLEGRYEVDVAAGGPAALAAAVRHPPDLVLGHLATPPHGGNDLAARLRAEPRTAHVPIILLGAGSGPSGVGPDADDYVATPVAPSELLARVRTAIRISDAREAATQKAFADTGHLRELIDAMLVVGAARTRPTALQALCDQARMMLAAAEVVAETTDGLRAGCGTPPRTPGDRVTVSIVAADGTAVGALHVVGETGERFDGADRSALRQLASTAAPSLLEG